MIEKKKIIFMNSEDSKTSDPQTLLLNLTNKTGLRRKYKYIALSILSIYYTWKNIKKSYENNKFNIQLQHGMKNLNYLMDHILYQIFKIILKIYQESTEKIQLTLQ